MPASTTTAQNILDAVRQDLEFAPTNTNTLLDYTDRVHQILLRMSRWKFLESAPQHFITEKDQTDYWVGATGTNPSGTVDTGLNLTDFDIVKRGSMFDRSNFRELQVTDEAPLLLRLGFQDDRSRPGRPATWRNAPDTPNVINIYPAPDNQNTYQPVPNGPYATSAAGGALAARTYYMTLTFVDSAGNESSPSDETSQFIPANSLVTVKSPAAEVVSAAAGISYSKYNVYVSTTSGSETKQNTNPITIGTDWTEPNTGLISGASQPGTNAITAMGGYVVEFRYYKTRIAITATNTVLQIPDYYKDVVVAGVNWMTAQFLKRDTEAAIFKGLFGEGIISMYRDKNLFPRGHEFIGPDSASVTRNLPSIESLDLTRFMLP